MARDNGFTPVQLRMLAVLADGMPHRREELHACLVDELGPLKNIQPHITAIRKHLRPKGYDVLCVARDRSYFYQHVRLLRRPKS